MTTPPMARWAVRRFGQGRPTMLQVLRRVPSRAVGLKIRALVRIVRPALDQIVRQTLDQIVPQTPPQTIPRPPATAVRSVAAADRPASRPAASCRTRAIPSSSE
jgi:hypothetical protein